MTRQQSQLLWQFHQLLWQSLISIINVWAWAEHGHTEALGRLWWYGMSALQWSRYPKPPCTWLSHPIDYPPHLPHLPILVSIFSVLKWEPTSLSICLHNIVILPPLLINKQKVHFFLHTVASYIPFMASYRISCTPCNSLCRVLATKLLPLCFPSLSSPDDPYPYIDS